MSYRVETSLRTGSLASAYQMVWPSRRVDDQPVLAQQRQMLGHRGIPDAQELGHIAHRLLAIDQLAQDHQPVPVGQRLEHFLGLGGLVAHLVEFYFHSCVYTIIRIYSQVSIGTLRPGTADSLSQINAGPGS